MKYVWVILICSIAWACTPKPVCYNDTNKSQIIRWGTYYAKQNKCDAFEIKSTAEVSKFTEPDHSDMQELGQADLVRYCRATRSVKNNLLRTQTYSTPGDTLLFIEFLNKDSGLQMRFSWNHKHKNDGNKYCLIALDSLNALVKTIE